MGDTGSHHAQARPDPTARRVRFSQIRNPRAGLLERRACDGHPPRRGAGGRSTPSRCNEDAVTAQSESVVVQQRPPIRGPRELASAGRRPVARTAALGADRLRRAAGSDHAGAAGAVRAAGRAGQAPGVRRRVVAIEGDRIRGGGAAGYRYRARCRPDAVAACRRCAVRQRLTFAVVEQVVAVAVGLVHRPRVRVDQTAGRRRHAVTALSGHPRHPGRGRCRRRAAGGTGVPVRRRLAGGAGVVRACRGLSGVDLVDDDPVRPAYSAVAALGRADER